jgi:ATP-dependent Clp protease ATP-binding subunit ClpC
MNAKFNDKVKQILALAEDEAREHNQDCVGAEHVLLGLLDEGNGIAIKAFESRGISIDHARRAAEQATARGKHRPLGRLPYTPQADRVLEAARQEAGRSSSGSVGTEHILLGLLKVRGTKAAQVLRGLGLSVDETRGQMTELTRGRQGRPPVRITEQPLGRAPERAAASPPTGSSVLDRFGRNLTWLAATGELPAAFGRDKETTELMQALSESSGRHPLLVGGTPDWSTVLEGLAQRIASGDVPPDLRGGQLYYSDPELVSALTSQAGLSRVSEVLAALLKDVRDRRDVILAFGNLPKVLADPRVWPEISNCARGIIGTVNHVDYRLDMAGNGEFGRLFTPVFVPDQVTAYDMGKLKATLRTVTYG